jgi:hypothetical protein
MSEALKFGKESYDGTRALDSVCLLLILHKSIRVTKLLMTNVGCFRKRFSSVRGFDLDHKIRVDDKIDFIVRHCHCRIFFYVNGF